ncbi:hypothetical protein KIK04_12000 [Paenibacillus sp. 481]|nr:hypothetical protein KIK04_12000 [Paenibacillus sp. 481]
MGMANGAEWQLLSFSSEDNMPGLLCIMENGTVEQSAEAATELFEQLCHEDVVSDAAFSLADTLLNIVAVPYKTVAKAVILNGMANLLRCASALDAPIFGTAPLKPAAETTSCFKNVERERVAAIAHHWEQVLLQRLPEWLELLEDEETTAIQVVYLLHMLQSQDERIEAGLQRAVYSSHRNRVRWNALTALSYCRQRLNKPFSPAIAFGQHCGDTIYEALRVVCMCVSSDETRATMHTDDWLALSKGCALPRTDRLLFPWGDGAPAAICAQAAVYALRQTSVEERVTFWSETLEKSIQAHQLCARKVTWEIGGSIVQWDEEWLQWNWTAPMLVADSMLLSLFGEGDSSTEMTVGLKRVLHLCIQHGVELPNAERYCIQHLIHDIRLEIDHLG